MPYTLKVYERDGTYVTDLTSPYAVQHLRQFGVGSGSFKLPANDPGRTALVHGRYVRIYDGAQLLQTIRIERMPRRRIGPKEGGDKVVTVFGRDGAAELDTAGVYPEGGIGGLAASPRMFGWTAGAYNDAAWTACVDMGRWDDPDQPFVAATLPDEWPDKRARRLWGAASTASGGVNEIQQVVMDIDQPPFPWGSDYPSASLDGTWRLTFRDQKTGAIQWDATNAAIETALEALSNCDGATVTGSNTTADPLLVEFDGPSVANRKHPLMTIDHSDLRHDSNSVSRTQEGSAAYAHDQGDVYFRRSFTIATAQDVVIHVAAADTAEVYIDGARVATVNRAGQYVTRSFRLTAGTHQFAAKVTNDDREDDDGNDVGWLLMTLTDTSGTVLLRTDDNAAWKCLAYPADVPGMLLGEILEVLFDEERAEGGLPGLTLGTTIAADSGGVAWTQDLTHGIPVGSSFLWAVEQLCELAGVKWYVTPDLVLEVFESPGVDRGGTPDSGLSTVALAEDGTIIQSDYDSDAPTATVLLVETQDSISEASDAAGISAYGRIVAGVTEGRSPDYGSLTAFVVRTFEQTASPHQPATIVYFDTAVVPGVTVDLGDLLQLPDDDGVASDWQLHGWSITQTDDNAVQIPTLMVEPA